MRGRGGACDHRAMTTSGARATPARPPAGPTARPPRLVRRADGRLLGGVAKGLAEHLRVDVTVVRLIFVVLTLAGGSGVLAYVAFWVLVPLARPGARGQRVDQAAGAPVGHDVGFLLALGSLAAGVLLLLQIAGLDPGNRLIWPFLLAALGVGVLWRQADEAQRARWMSATRSTPAATWLRTLGGAVLVAAGVVAFLGGQGRLAQAQQGLLAIGAVVAGVAVISGPYWLRMARELSTERAERIRSQERAELAAHVHDSVLHTLTLIQRNVDDPRAVTRLARAQERELRTWLYRPVSDPDTTLAAGLERLAAEVEDAHGVTVEVVVVGDCPLDDRLRVLLQAAREALVNAAKYAGAAPIAVYAEVESRLVSVFVRDRGPGFDLAAVPADRHGVRDSIVGRMQRVGGSALVRARPGEGTEVQLEVALGGR